ncbi:MAG: ribosome maturation factor RimP [Rhodospirillales bacterium]
MAIEQRVAEIIEPALDDMGYTLVRVQLSGGKRAQLQVMAEHKNFGPMTVDDCAKISRAVSALLDVEDPIPGAYHLEVSSPGIDRPLVRPADYDRFKGLLAKLDVARPIDGRKRFKGRIAGIDGDTVTVETDNGPLKLDFGDIAKASLIITDDLLKAAPERGLS